MWDALIPTLILVRHTPTTICQKSNPYFPARMILASVDLDALKMNNETALPDLREIFHRRTRHQGGADLPSLPGAMAYRAPKGSGQYWLGRSTWKIWNGIENRSLLRPSPRTGRGRDGGSPEIWRPKRPKSRISTSQCIRGSRSSQNILR